MTPYDGPIYFEAVPCSPSCTSSPSTLTSLSRHETHAHEAKVSLGLVESEVFEWTKGDSEAGIDSLSRRRMRHPSSCSCLNDVPRPILPGSRRSFDFLTAPVNDRLLTYPDDAATEMTPATHSRNLRTLNGLQPRKIKERFVPSAAALSFASALDPSPRSEPKPFSTLPPRRRNSIQSRHASSISIWSWVSGIDKTQQPLLDDSASRRSDFLQVPCDVDMDRDSYFSSRAVPSSFNSHLSAEMSELGSSRSSPFRDRRPPAFDSASYTSDRIAEACLKDWQPSMDDAQSFLVSSPCPSSCSSTMGIAATLPGDAALLEETAYRSLLDRWPESDVWKEEDDRERENSVLGANVNVDADVTVDAYPRSAAPSPQPSDIEMHPAVLPALLDQQGFSTLMLQSFTLALADAALEGSDGFELFSSTRQAEMEDAGGLDSSYLPDLQNFDSGDQWSPPALRSSSSASSLDPFHLELFSPASEQTDPAAVWEAHRSPDESSDSCEYFSSSPFVGWSSSSDAEVKPALLTLGGLPMPTIASTLANVPLYQPQPIRPIPPIDIPDVLIDELPERRH